MNAKILEYETAVKECDRVINLALRNMAHPTTREDETNEYKLSLFQFLKDTQRRKEALTAKLEILREEQAKAMHTRYIGVIINLSDLAKEINAKANRR